jgi:hypothetical protein
MPREDLGDSGSARVTSAGHGSDIPAPSSELTKFLSKWREKDRNIITLPIILERKAREEPVYTTSTKLVKRSGGPGAARRGSTPIASEYVGERTPVVPGQQSAEAVDLHQMDGLSNASKGSQVYASRGSRTATTILPDTSQNSNTRAFTGKRTPA